jgi:hypothetical protein
VGPVIRSNDRKVQIVTQCEMNIARRTATLPLAARKLPTDIQP